MAEILRVYMVDENNANAIDEIFQYMPPFFVHQLPVHKRQLSIVLYSSWRVG